MYKRVVLGLVFLSLFLIACNLIEDVPEQEEFPVVIQFLDTCDYDTILDGDYYNTIEASRFTLVQTNLTFFEIKQINKMPCVIKSFKVEDLEDELEALQAEFDSERDDHFREIKLNRSVVHEDVTDREELLEYLEQKRQEEAEELGGSLISEYQLYVTPNSPAVQELANTLGSDIQTIYDEALSWIWVSEEYLNGVPEKWFYPEQFITLTPNLANNPSPGDIASDCSEQANTLVSLLIASGYDVDNVRVVLGLVDFDGVSGGHAWAEIYENERWFALEATSGAYFDETTSTLYEAGMMPYTYFKHHTYPAEEVWYYYNNAYFKEIGGTSNAPEHWNKASRSYLQEDLESYHRRTPPQGRAPQS